MERRLVGGRCSCKRLVLGLECVGLLAAGPGLARLGEIRKRRDCGGCRTFGDIP